MIYDNDADLAQLDGKTVAILGYGSQGHAHALNLKESGVDVVVGLRQDSSSVEKARADGLEVLPIADATSRGDVVMVLLPDEKQAEVWEAEIADGIAPGDLVLAYARGVGCTRAGVIETTFREETETDLFGEQAVLCGGVTELVRAGYET